MNRWEMEKKIVIAALKDSSFKKKLIVNPKEALKELFKNDLDTAYMANLNIKVQEEKKNEWVIPLPHLDLQGRQLSDIELENIAGGCGAGSGETTYGGC